MLCGTSIIAANLKAVPYIAIKENPSCKHLAFQKCSSYNETCNWEINYLEVSKLSSQILEVNIEKGHILKLYVHSY